MIPEDIPQDDNDSVLEEQIRLAAMNEKDPEKKKDYGMNIENIKDYRKRNNMNYQIKK